MTERTCDTCKHGKPWDKFLANLRCDEADKRGMLHDAFFWRNFGDCAGGKNWEARQ